jgi:CubicO group peptidase (beta-lactamase class C family)
MNTTTRIRLALTALLVICLPVMAAITPTYAQPLRAETDFAAVDAYVEGQRQALHIPGLALAIVQGDQVAYLHGYGQAAPGGRAVTPQTPFMIGSVTKSFTALAIMQLVEAGQVALDAPVRTYLPWFRVADPQASARITLRHLLNQTSGFSTGSGLQEMMASDLSDAAIEAGVRRLADDELSHVPGAVYEYSNVNFNILGLIVQTVSGQSFESYIQEHIFDPLEMQRSFTSLDRAAEAGMARGHMLWFGMPIPKEVPFNRGGLPNGFLICSAEDMAHYLTAQLNEGRYGNVSVLSPQGVAAMHQPAVPQQTPEAYYGMGWEIGQIEGVPAVFHSGDNADFQTHVLLLPTEKLGVVVLLNAQGLSINTGASQIASGVLAVVTGKQPKPYTLPVEGMILPVGSVLVPVALSLLWIGWMLFRFLRRQKQGLPARRSIGWYGWVVVLPLIVDLSLLWVLLMGIPRLWGVPLSVIAAYFPEVFTLLIGSVVALGVWGLARTLLTLRPAPPSAPAVSQPQAVP